MMKRRNPAAILLIQDRWVFWKTVTKSNLVDCQLKMASISSIQTVLEITSPSRWFATWQTVRLFNYSIQIQLNNWEIGRVTGATQVSHNGEDEFHLNSTNSNRPIDYFNSKLEQIVALIRFSNNCRQEIRMESCADESFSWWMNRNKVKNRLVTIRKSFDVTGMEDLPVIELISQRPCNFRLGKLVCYGTKISNYF